MAPLKAGKDEHLKAIASTSILNVSQTYSHRGNFARPLRS